ncbi:MAG: type IV secretion system protein [Alphaproteobacteria bacterium]|nr:type IV secretion system protein [Alphaproteobacteria bacterium]
MVTQQIESGTQVKAISDQTKSTPEFLEKMIAQTEGAKLTYYLWLSRLFIVTAVASMLLLISFSLSLFRLAPMVSVEPFLVINQDNSNEIVRYEPITKDMASKTKMMEMFVRQYVITRNTFINDPTEMRTRWLPGGIINYLSAPNVFLDFYVKVDRQWAKLFSEPTSKEVEIISVKRQGGEKSPVWKVDFKTYELSDMSGSASAREQSNFRVRYWTASVTSYFIAERVFLSRRLLNPLGFTVTRYSQSEVEVF